MDPPPALGRGSHVMVQEMLLKCTFILLASSFFDYTSFSHPFTKFITIFSCTIPMSSSTSGNQLNGTIPDSIGNFFALQFLYGHYHSILISTLLYSPLSSHFS